MWFRLTQCLIGSAILLAVPGLQWGAAAFIVYVAYDKLTGSSTKEEHH